MTEWQQWEYFLDLAKSKKRYYPHSKSVELIRAVMEHVGLWDEFVANASRIIYDLTEKTEPPVYLMDVYFEDRCIADILTDPALLIQACISFMEGRK